MALKVIGAGLGRTGTLSLKFALEYLGYGPCHHMAEFFANMPDQLPKWLDVVNGRPDWDAVFDGYQSCVDYPGCTYWPALAAHWPDAKIILSLRDPESWFASASETIMSPDMRKIVGNSPAKPFFDVAVDGDIGDRSQDREFMIDYFQRWNAGVIAQVPPERLLVFEARQGWASLCAFLGVPIPDVPYPRVNTRAGMMQRIDENARHAREAMMAAGPPTAEQMAVMGRMRLEKMRAEAFPQAANVAE